MTRTSTRSGASGESSRGDAPTPRNILVIGGTLFIGRELVRRLLARGDRVTILHRRRSSLRPGTGAINCDRNDKGRVRRALRGRRFDLVYDNVYDRSAEQRRIR